MRKQKRQSEQNRWMRSPVKEHYWRKQIALWQDSGLSVRAFCKEHGVVETSFYAWRRELIVRARECTSADMSIETEKLTPNTVKDGRGRTISVRFRQTDHRALQSIVAEKPESPFVPLSIVPDGAKSKESNGSQEGLRLTTPSGYQIWITESVDLDLLGKLLITLEKNQC
jgi:transposase-like protein